MTERANPEGRSGPGSPGGSAAGGPGPVTESFSPFGAALEPALLRACEGRLKEVHWFRTDWQRGGALTGYANFLDEHERPVPVVVKLPIPPRERRWLLRLQEAADVVPTVYAQGESLNGYDFAWIVMRRMTHGPLGAAWGGREFDLLVEAAVRFYRMAAHFEPEGNPTAKDWDGIFHRSRQFVHDHSIAHEQRWNTALKKAHRHLKNWLAIWNDRPHDQWCHGDLHLGNAMTSEPAPEGPAVLIDFAETHVGCWVEDAVYFEHLYWARRDRLAGRKLCSMIAHQRKAAGLKVEPDWPRWASIRRALVAMSTPAMLEHDGDPAHVEASLEVLEREAN